MAYSSWDSALSDARLALDKLPYNSHGYAKLKKIEEQIYSVTCTGCCILRQEEVKVGKASRLST